MMLRTGRGIVAVLQGGTRSWIKCWIKTEHAPVTYAAALVTSSQKLQHEEKDLVTEASLKFSEAKDVPSLIQLGLKGGSALRAYQTIQVLSQWVEEKKVNFKKDVEKDENFARLLSVIERDMHMDNPILLLAGLKNLHKLGINENAFVIQCAENQLLWNVRKVKIPVLLSIVAFQVQHQNTELQRKVLKEVIETIQRRWVEINVKDIQLMYSLHDKFTLDFLGRLDDRTIELAEDMKYSELCSIFSVLGTAKRRATPVLRALAFHMAKQEDKLPAKQLSNVLYAMHTLNFPDQVLLEKIGNDLIPQVASIDRPSIVGAILFCMGQMRWRQTNLLEVLSEWIENNVGKCRVNDVVSLILTLANVAYTPTNADSMFTKVIPSLNSSSVNRETVWLDVVWSLALLGRATNDHVSSVLDPHFVSKTASVAQHLRMGIRLKLLNINAVAELMMPSYSGPYLEYSDFRDTIITQSRNEIKLSKHIQSMLRNFLPPPKYMNENIQTPMGVLVHCEFAVNKKGKPIPIQDYSDNFGELESSNPLPEGAFKMTLFGWDYKDYTIGSQELTGVNQLAVKLMEKKGYIVVHVPYFEYSVRAKTINNIQYLENKIKEVSGVS